MDGQNDRSQDGRIEVQVQGTKDRRKEVGMDRQKDGRSEGGKEGQVERRQMERRRETEGWKKGQKDGVRE